MTGKISEIFESVQGEGLYFGERQLFIRFFGCNLRCKFCDTKQPVFIECDVRQLFNKIMSYKSRYRFISFTGGEPLLQKDFLKQILELTHKGNFKNYLETNGTLADALADVIDYVDIVSMDLKFPSSTGIKESLWVKHRKFLKIAAGKDTFVKAVITEDTQEDDLYTAINLLKETARGVVFVLQPNYYDDPQKLGPKLARFKDACLQEGVIACIIPQMHKMMGLQ